MAGRGRSGWDLLDATGKRVGDTPFMPGGGLVAHPFFG
jgi:hypothetical protein